MEPTLFLQSIAEFRREATSEMPPHLRQVAMACYSAGYRQCLDNLKEIALEHRDFPDRFEHHLRALKNSVDAQLQISVEEVEG